MSPRIQGWVPTAAHPILAVVITLALLAAGGLWTILARVRGPHDRLVGAWVVPR